MTSASGEAGVDLDGTIGAMEVGIIFNVFLTGAVTLQSYNYYTRFPQDPNYMRWLIFLTWLAELGQTICFLHVLYRATVTTFGSLVTLIHPPRSLVLTMVFGGVATALVQAFLAFRVYQLTHILPLVVVCWILTFARLLGCLSVTGTGWNMSSLPEYEAEFKWIFTALLITGLVNDLTITTGLSMSLFRSKQNAQKRTSAVIEKLILWTVESGLATACLSATVVISFFTMPHNYVWIGVYCISPKLYSNALLAILNGRAALRHQIDSNSGASLSVGATQSLFNAPVQDSMGLPLDIKMTRGVQHRSTHDYELGPLGKDMP
ncbi:hypothetical protein DL96DRAFT_568577 [Flagelloscypha sp. PMI_526]|nr:hypothetical protein DL96DRAFT_568577 [Flagelloscypha sp. PMI_526]